MHGTITARSILFLVFCCVIRGTFGQTYNYNEIRETFKNDLLDQLGDGAEITFQTLEDHFKTHTYTSTSKSLISECLVDNSTSPVSLNKTCLLQKCLTPEDVYQLSGLAEQTTEKEVSTVAMMLVHLMENKTCGYEGFENKDEIIHQAKPSSAEAWGFGILCTTIISLCSLGGLIALPFVHGINYKKILIYMVGLAVGTLAGSSLLFLIPEALELTEQELNEHSYVWKCLVMISGIYLFFIIERVLKIITRMREKTKQDKKLHHEIQPGRFASFHEAAPEPEYRDLDTLPHISPCGDNISRDEDSQSNHSRNDVTTKHEHKPNGRATHNGHTHMHGHVHNAANPHQHVAPVAWMIIFGDGLHNFIDGVSIGAAFTESILAGVSVSVAILCEELPHELGDFAVLLNAGMKIKRAVLYNFLSACMCYLGLVVGIFLGENTAAHTWVFAFAGGMFLYIALVDMMPEMNTAGESEENKKLIGEGQIFLLQNLGLITGFAIMFIMAVYGGDLEATIKGEGH
ncbi:metal cation symporter ZIP14-like [Ruditapes philippinarum]|uniref:metal cation symporter ZIP14-like n=1 Tax=Ruditapes philippinarum TaxID=129788 RepID=UPI00295B32B4|nr:metal cation symporter ZIP14-like [Ruditapes philippinarum]